MKRYQECWQSAFKNNESLWIQVTVLGIPSGDSPIHNRYIITNGKGIRLGQSVNGLGLSDSEMNILNADEATAIEKQFVDPVLGPQYGLFKGEKLIVYPFII